MSGLNSTGLGNGRRGALVNAVVTYQVPYGTGRFLNNWATVNLSKWRCSVELVILPSQKIHLKIVR
jgi:hypothetical protein